MIGAAIFLIALHKYFTGASSRNLIYVHVVLSKYAFNIGSFLVQNISVAFVGGDIFFYGKVTVVRLACFSARVVCAPVSASAAAISHGLG